MKIVTIHWTEKRVIEVPITCPTNSVNCLIDWISGQEPYTDLESLSIDRESHDMEIVNVNERKENGSTIHNTEW